MYTLYLSIHLFYSLSAYYAQYTNTDEWTLYNAQCNVNVHNTFIVDTWYSLIQYSIQFTVHGIYNIHIQGAPIFYTVYSLRYIQYTYIGCLNILYSSQFTVYSSRYIQYTYTGCPNILYSLQLSVYTIYIYRLSQYYIQLTVYGI